MMPKKQSYMSRFRSGPYDWIRITYRGRGSRLQVRRTILDAGPSVYASADEGSCGCLPERIGRAWTSQECSTDRRSLLSARRMWYSPSCSVEKNGSFTPVQLWYWMNCNLGGLVFPWGEKELISFDNRLGWPRSMNDCHGQLDWRSRLPFIPKSYTDDALLERSVIIQSTGFSIQGV